MSNSKPKRPQRDRIAAPTAPDTAPLPAITEPAAAEVSSVSVPALLVPVAALESVPVAPVDETPTIEAVSKTAADTAEDVFALGRTALDAFADSQSAMARGLEAIAVEATALMRSGMSAAADAGSAMLGARTFADAIEVQAGFARRSIDAALDGSARLSEITVKAVADASRPILSRMDETWRGIN